MGMLKRNSWRLLAVAEHQGCEQSGGFGACHSVVCIEKGFNALRKCGKALYAE